MNGKLPYESPTLSKWGSITDLTQGTGRTNSSDDFTSCLPEMNPDEDTSFVGSNDNEALICP
jgi:hypothetical protein